MTTRASEHYNSVTYLSANKSISFHPNVRPPKIIRAQKHQRKTPSNPSTLTLYVNSKPPVAEGRAPRVPLLYKPPAQASPPKSFRTKPIPKPPPQSTARTMYPPACLLSATNLVRLRRSVSTRRSLKARKPWARSLKPGFRRLIVSLINEGRIA